MSIDRGTIILHGGRKMSFRGSVRYFRGRTNRFEDVDCDKIAYFSIVSFTKQSGYQPSKMWYRKPHCSLAKGLKEILSDVEVSSMVSSLTKANCIDVYVEGTELNDEGSDNVEVESDDVEVESDDGDRDKEDVLDEDGGVVDILSEYEDSQAELNSENGTEGEQSSKACRSDKFSMYNPDCDHVTLTFKIGLTFDSIEQFKEAVQDYATYNGVNVHWVREDSMRAEAACVDGCPWHVYASTLQRERTIVVKATETNHKCTRSLTNRQATVKWLAREFIRTNRNLDTLKARDVIHDVLDKYAVEVKKLQVYRAKWYAQKLVNGTVDDHYKKVRSYLAHLSKNCVGSTFKLDLELTPIVGLNSTFRRFYVGFDELKKGFRLRCRNVAGFDGTFLKHRLGGILLSAVGRDGNNHMFSIAWAAVEGENTMSWSWFLRILFEDLCVNDGSGWTFISDKQKGLIHVVAELAPHAEHRNCARHVYANWKCSHRGQALKKCFWAAVKSTNEATYKIALTNMRLHSTQAVADFLSKGPEHFCKVFFHTTTKSDATDNNMCETFNSYIALARTKPIVDMLDEIRSSLMERMYHKSKLFENRSDDICPDIRGKIEDLKLSAGKWIPRPCIGDQFEVVRRNEKFVVKLAELTCSCRQWDLSGIPCPHAISCMNFMKYDVDAYVSSCYKREMYSYAYKFPLKQLEGENMWPESEGEPIIPPPFKKQPGRPRKKRKKGEDEQPKERMNNQKKWPRKGLDMKCSLCHQFSHNKRTCKAGAPTLEEA